MEEQTDISPNYFKKVRGSDPRLATCRGKLQNQRAKLNQEINKQIMIRNGAERLYKVTTNKKLRETVALELSFVNSNLQRSKEKMGTKPISVNYTKQKAVRTPTRDHNGFFKTLLGFFTNLLYFIDRRFFPPHRNMGIFFEWFDSLTGVPSTQKTIAFEKASVLFNIAALYTQIAAKQDRLTSSGVDAAVDNFLRAAGMFRYIRDNFSNAPSMDLSPGTLDTLIQLMLAQARECLFEKLIPGVEKLGLQPCLEVAQEAEQVSSVYRTVHKVMSSSSVKDYVPYSWISLLLVKSEHYRALGHHYAAVGLLEHNGEIDKEAEAYLEYVHCPDANNSSTCIDIRVPHTTEERRQLGKAHLRASLLLHEEGLRLHRMCRQLRQIDNLQERLRMAHDASLDRYQRCEQEDDFQEILDAPPIQAATKYQLTLMPPEFNEYQVDDLFHDLGPLKVFSARRQWTAARTVTWGRRLKILVRWGEAGMKEGDFIVYIGNTDTKWMGHEEVVRLIREAGNELTLKVVTPIDHDYLHPKSNGPHPRSPGPKPPTLVSPDLSRVHLRSNSNPFSKDKRRRATWNFFRRSQSKERQFPIISDVVYR
ncbi:Rhophilin-2 like protein [Argiope bruennichi]|uniref:Rhophilin-2 like protein n=1 Tax=Argiope bruennichi TaxID=94029 RepID=A0A8T0EQC1_ARGBR|nr:Rhophilin-2 like protein [Argiope bruennichi]